MSYQSYYPVNPARRMAYLLDMPRQPCESCGLVLVVSVLRIDSLHAMSAQVTWGAWFDFVTGILLFRALLGFGSTWDGPDFELIVGDPNSMRTRPLMTLYCLRRCILQRNTVSDNVGALRIILDRLFIRQL